MLAHRTAFPALTFLLLAACGSPSGSRDVGSLSGETGGTSGGTNGASVGGSTADPSGGSLGASGDSGTGAVGGTQGTGGSGGGASNGSGGTGGSVSIDHPPNPCVGDGTCPPGTWIDVTPDGLDLVEYGVQDVVADPVRPNDLYAFICYRGVWKSTDYGLTWTHVSTGAGSTELESGRPWTAAIDPSLTRDSEASPALYTASGYGNLGLHKSTDGGVSWTRYELGNTQGATSSDVYSLDVDPYDSSHLIAGFHDVGISESTDAGATWSTVSVPGNFGSSVYIWFVQTGDASTSSTWLTQAQWNSNTSGMWRTTNAGANWTQVQTKLEHGHGSAQIHQDGQGNIYAAGAGGGTGVIFRSTDFAATWSAVDNGNVGQNGAFGTPNYVYATLPAAVGGEQAQHLQRAPASDGTSWADWAPTAPEGMTNGAKRAAVTFDGEHYVIVTGNWMAGIWRYVE